MNATIVRTAAARDDNEIKRLGTGTQFVCLLVVVRAKEKFRWLHLSKLDYNPSLVVVVLMK